MSSNLLGCVTRKKIAGSRAGARGIMQRRGKNRRRVAPLAHSLKEPPAPSRPSSSPRLSSQAILALEKEREILTKQIKSLSESAGDLPPGVEKAPVESSFLSDGKPVVAILIDGKPARVLLSDPMAYRMYEDAQRQIRRLQYDFGKIEFLLSPPKGRPSEEIYQRARGDKLDDPELTTRQLAERHFPYYFPERADAAIRMMDQGLRRAARRAMKKKVPSK
jgi:hypothetical protein